MAIRRILSRAALDRLLDQYEPHVRSAFISAVDDLKEHADVSEIVRSLERGDIDGALRAVNLDPAAFRAFERAIGVVFDAGGSATSAAMPTIREPSGARVVFRFDARAPRAEAWLSNHSSRLVTNIVTDQQSAIRSALTNGMELGNNPRTTALDIVGRYNRATGRRDGGVIGLTSQQEQFVANARAELLSGDPARLRAYLDRARRDARFDNHVLSALKSGEAIDGATVTRMLSRYSDRLLDLRGETIARSESLSALSASHEEAMRQSIDSGAVAAQDVTKTWRTAKDARVRDSHAAQDGETVGINDRFSNGLRYPHEEGAPARETINCRCISTYSIDHLAGLE